LQPANAFADDDEPFTAPIFSIGGGLTSTQAWSAVLTLLRQQGVTAGDLDLWLRPLVLLEFIPDDDTDRLVLGAPNRSTATRVQQRFAHQIEAAFAALLGHPVAVAIILTHDWLDARQSASA
jgi:chromosomal replication initiation ATPase DnaA